VATRLRRADPRTGWLIAVGGAFAASAVVFSYASGIFHPYYVSFLAPWTAMLVGAGVGQALAVDRRGRIVGPLAIVGGAVTELVVLGNLSGTLSWARPLVIVAGLAGAVSLAMRLAPRLRAAALAVTVAALLAAPATWATETLGHATSSTFPAGGSASASTGGPGGGGRPGGLGHRAFRFGGAPPGGAGGFGAPPAGAGAGVQSLFGGSAGRGRGVGGFGGGGGPGGLFGGDSTSLRAAARYAAAHGGGAIGVESQESAASAIIDSGANVAGLGGFSGRESTVSVPWLAMEVRAGRLRWILAGGSAGGSRGGFGGVGGDSRQGSASALAIAQKVGRKVTFTSNGTQVTMYDLQGRAGAMLAAAGTR
jgi:hypothetical protein